MNQHTFKKEFIFSYPVEEVWGFLNCMETFVEGQIWPYKVEFENPTGGAPEFVTGTLNNHFGPFLNFAGVLVEINKPVYRDLKYNYGAYFLGFRLIRPTRLQFWFNEEGENTKVILQVDSLTGPGFHRLWTIIQRVFWGAFPAVVNRELRKRRI